jgi:rhodanese-related sulfurtransferase
MSLLTLLSSLVKPAPRIQPAEYAGRLRTGEAVLVDIREPAEWARGVAESATLLPLSDLRGERKQWRAFLASHAGKEILLYCASGMRSASAAHLLQAEGVRAVNAGALGDWAAAGWLIVPPKSR